ncbi:MAG: hypothetical protein KatS3mg006_0698 [Pyrinomonadaceae bacterium]|nr:MAG: hypothetical protein KatS3mg006_0698 [Pyrinomonadaceae bacterium]
MRKYLKFVLLLLLTILIIWFFGRNVDWNEVKHSLQKANAFYLALAVLSTCIGYWFRAKRWQVLLSPITESSMKELFATTTVGFAAIFFVGRMGEIVRPMWLPMRDRRVRPSAALVTLGVERILDFASLICFFSLNLIWFTPPPGKEADFEYFETVGWIIFAVIFGSIGLLILYSKVSQSIITWTEQITVKFPSKIRRITLSLLKQLAAALKILSSPRASFSAIFWTIALWFSIALPTWLVLKAFNLPLSITDALFIMGFAAFSSVIPTPGGAAGAFHTATAGSLIFLGIGREESVATAIVMHLVYFSPAVFFGLYYFLHGDLSLSKFKEMLFDSESELEKTLEQDLSKETEQFLENQEKNLKFDFSTSE